MNREEMIKELKTVYLGDSIKMREAKNMAIEALQQEPCEDAISREETLKALMDEWTEFDSELIDSLIGKIKKLPSVTPQPKMGKWLPIEYDGYADGSPVWDKWECSECGCEHNGDEESLTAFCPDCGRKMEVGENG